MSITPTKQIIFIHNFNFDDKILVRFKKFNEKITKLHNVNLKRSKQFSPKFILALCQLHQ